MEREAGLRVAVVGATGLVGETIGEVIRERDFPAAEVVPFASLLSLGDQPKNYDGPINLLFEDNIEGFGAAIFSAGNEVSREWAPQFEQHGTFVVTNDEAFRVARGLIVPEVNPHRIEHGINANPNCATIQEVLTVAPLREELSSLTIRSYQSVSGKVRRAIEELHRQQRSRTGPKSPKIFPGSIALNMFPEHGEAQKISTETRKILELPDDFPISAESWRVPVPRGHLIEITITTRDGIGVEEARERIGAAEGVLMNPDTDYYPCQEDAVGRDEILVGGFKVGPVSQEIRYITAGDNLRKGAALNAVQILEEANRQGLLSQP